MLRNFGQILLVLIFWCIFLPLSCTYFQCGLRNYFIFKSFLDFFTINGIDGSIIHTCISLGIRIQFQNGTNLFSCKKWRPIWPFIFNLIIQDTHMSSEICYSEIWNLFGRKLQACILVIRSYITLTCFNLKLRWQRRI